MVLTAEKVLKTVNELLQDGATGALPGPYTAPANATGTRQNASQIVAKIVGQTQGRVQGQQILIRVAKEANIWVEREVPLAGLLGMDDPDLNRNHAEPSKGSIVVTGDGEILDGRHRAFYAKKNGETTIMAYVPIGSE